MFEDLRAATRTLVRSPIQTALVLGILALGLTATTAVFTYVNGFYQPFPGADPDGLVRLFGVNDENPFEDIAYLDYLDYAERAETFEEIAAVQPFYAASVRREAMTEVAYLEAVSRGYFSVLGVETVVGRALTAEDDDPAAEPVAVLSHAWWQRSFGGDEAVIGTTLYLNFRPFTVVGVTSPEFVGSTSGYRPDAWIPIAPFADRYTGWARYSENRDIPLVQVYGRLRPGVRTEVALEELRAIAAGLDEAYPRTERSRSLRIDGATWIDPRSRLDEMPTVRMMLAAAAGLLLLVCANVANLLLSLATRRQHELALRAALGASPGRLLRTRLIENVVLSAIAGGIAVVLAVPVSARIGSYFARPAVWNVNVPREATLDLRVVLFAVGVSLLTGIVAGLLPALRASKRDLVTMLKADAGGAVGETGGRWWRPGVQDVLVTTQVGLSVVLLVVAALVLRTLATVTSIDPGFRYERLLVSHVSTSSTEIQTDEREQFFREMAERLSEESWVHSATVSGRAPLSPQAAVQILVEGQPEPVQLPIAPVIPGFFETMDIDVLHGRAFVATDTTESPDVAIVSASLAERYFSGESSIGRHVSFMKPAGDGTTAADSGDVVEGRRFEIVGVASDAKMQDFIADADPIVYLAYPQHPYPSGSALVVDAAVPPPSAIPMLYRWLRDLEPHLAIVNVIPYTDVVSGLLYVQRMNAELFSVLATLGLVLAAVGVFSVMSLAVGRRTREIGVRMAIGARRGDIVRWILRRALVPVAVGIALGLIGAFALTGVVRSLLTEVEPLDPVALVAGTLVLLAAALLATLFPVRRATSVDPVTALRGD